jgi:hypothetical protein
MLCDSHRFDLYQRDVPGGRRLRRMHGPSGDVELGVANEMKPTATWTGSWTELQAPGAHGVHGVPMWRCRRARMDWVSSGEPMSGAFVMLRSGQVLPAALLETSAHCPRWTVCH